MDLTYSAGDLAFRDEVRGWLEQHLSGDRAHLRGEAGPGRGHASFADRVAWERQLAEARWCCLGWPEKYGGRELPLVQQMLFHEEYARANAPARVSHIGQELLGPTLVAYGTDAQRERFLPRIRDVSELWCQGYSEPGAGSDLASVSTKAVLDGDQWVIDGQKVWTSLAKEADWCFVLARSEPGSRRHRGLSFLLVPMDQEGVEVRPIRQLTGTAEFNEVFFDGARTSADHVVGEPGDGWRIAMALLGFERGVSTIGQQVGFARELDAVIALARENGAIDDPLVRDRLVGSRMGLDVMRLHALRTLSAYEAGSVGAEASISKLVWANWHRELGEIAMQVAGASSLVTAAGDSEPWVDERASRNPDAWQRLFLFTRADTIYGGSNEIQRNIIAERVLGLPRERRPGE